MSAAGTEPASGADPAPAPTVDPTWVSRTSAATGVPAPAVRAYGQAQLSGIAGCDLGWTTLAGIGWIESQHGTLGGRTLGEDGRSSSPILGPALDGTGDVAAIRSTPASAAWHGDRRWEHAIGPMQFLASTWDRWATDGDGDGSADPLDLDDAAAAAARYLCASGTDLVTGPAWSAAVLSYNPSREYVDSVRRAAQVYVDRLD
ncbi:lytic murein transglycosylase [Nocardioides kribbensis]|uniref:lytic murein transglycosylase n=1 Tax=Nocardioides kribbensis TaxID=305517 RepID=UPI0029D41BFE|nr:lytic murein transglycosylase [Nocardioides kribbensis]